MLKQVTDIQLNMERLLKRPKNPRTVQPKLLDAWSGLQLYTMTRKRVARKVEDEQLIRILPFRFLS